MSLLLEPSQQTIVYSAEFENAQLSWLKEGERFALAQKILSLFNLRVTELTFDWTSVSNRFLKFTRFINPTFFDVSFGVEQVTVNVSNPISIEQISKFFELFFQLFDNIPLKLQRYTIQQQNVTKGDRKAYLERLVPYTPENFQKLLFGRGITYNLSNKEIDMKSFITISDSIIVENGLFLYVQMDFSPSRFGPSATSRIAVEQFTFFMKELDLSFPLPGA